MAFPLPSKILKTALVLSALTVGQALAQNSSNPLRSGQNFTGVFTSHTNAAAKVNALVSRPGNSQDFMALGGGNWQHQTNSAYTYDSQGRLTQRLYTNPATSQNERREIMVYDAQGNEIEYRTEYWNGATWSIVDAYRSVITYNAQNLKTEIIYQSWDSNMNQWENEGREQFAYDANNLVASITNSEWNFSGWDLIDRMVLSNLNGTATSATIQEYNGAMWEDVYKAINLTWHVLYEIPSVYILQYNDNGIWVNEERYNAVYNANGGHVGVYEEWNMQTSTWDKTSRETESFDSNKNYTGWLNEDWNPGNNTWDFGSEDREILTYSGINVTQRIYQDSYNQNSVLEDRRKEVYSNFQTFNISGLKELAETAVNIYPNPTSAILTIAFPEYKGAFMATVSDVTGKTWQTKIFNAGEAKQLNLEALPKGIYMLQLQTETGLSVKRIVKQ